MRITSLDTQFLYKDTIDEYESAIWTERYQSSGDVQIVTRDTPENIAKLAEGTFLAEAETNEVMILLDSERKEGKLKVTGKSLLEHLNNRVVRQSIQHFQKSYTAQAGVGQIIAAVVYAGVHTDDTSRYAMYNAGLSIDEDIPRLELGPIDNGPTIQYAMQYGPILEIIKPLAESYSLGIKLYLAYANPGGDYRLEFSVYSGQDRTNGQSTYKPVMFSPARDSLDKVREYKSIAGYKNLCYAFAAGLPENFNVKIRPGVASLPNGVQTGPVGFNRRTMMIFCDDFKLAEGQTSVPTAQVAAMLEQRARDALYNNNYVRFVDGEIIPQAGYKYKTDYFLGDLIELTNVTGPATTARVTEYIRTDDENGERGYPTVSVM